MPEYTAYLQDVPVAGYQDVVLVPEGATAPAAHTSIGTFEHDGTPLHKTHAVYHHVRDLLYPLKVWNMEKVRIKYDDEILPLSYALSLDEITVEAEDTGTVEIFVIPGIANMGTFSAASSDTDVATVVVDGRTITVTGVAAGTATVTVSHSILDDEMELEVTVTAAD